MTYLIAGLILFVSFVTLTKMVWYLYTYYYENENNNKYKIDIKKFLIPFPSQGFDATVFFPSVDKIF